MTWPPELDATVSAVCEHLKRRAPGDPLGAYLFGSAVTSGLRPHSDIDILALTNRSLTADERQGWVEALLPLSGWAGHAKLFPNDRFPGVSSRRPIELTSISIGDLTGWPAQPVRDFQYGEWLRADLLTGPPPAPSPDPDVVPLLATAHHRYRLIFGEALPDSTRPPRGNVDAAMVATLPELLAGIRGDETNTLLTLSRILTTLQTGHIFPKDVAAEHVSEYLSLTRLEHRTLIQAASNYRGTIRADWSDAQDAAAALAHTLAEHAYSIHGR